jgi:hypothetical protein
MAMSLKENNCFFVTDQTPGLLFVLIISETAQLLPAAADFQDAHEPG